MNIQVINLTENPKTLKATVFLENNDTAKFSRLEYVGNIGSHAVHTMISDCGTLTALGYYRLSDYKLENVDHVELNTKYRRSWQA